MGDVGLHYTLDEALSTIGFGNFHVLALMFAGFGLCGDAIEVILLSIVQPAITAEWGLSSGEESMLTSVVFTGTLFGGYFWGLVSDTYGRRAACIGAISFTMGAGFLCAFSPGYVTLIVLLCFVGFGIGGGHVFTSWFLEFAPSSNRGSWTISTAIFWACGTMFEGALAWIIMPRLGWRWLIGLSCIPSFLVLLSAVAFVPESPRFLCLKDRITEAHQVLEKVARTNQAKLPPGILVSDAPEDDEECASSEETPLLSPREKTGYCESGPSSVLKLFAPKLRKTTIILWLLYLGVFFSYNTLVFMTSELSSGQANCGKHKMLSVSLHESFQDATSYMEIFITTFAELLSACFCAVVVDRAGRKLTMVIGCVMSFVLLSPLVVHQNDIVTTASLFGTRMFVPVLTSVLGVYGSEVYPTFLRSTGAGVATSVGRLGGIVSPVVAVYLINDCHQTAAVIVFELVLLVIGLLIVSLPVETNGKVLSDFVADDEKDILSE